MTYIFWDVLPCGLVEVCQYFGETHCLHLQDKSKPTNKPTRTSRQAGHSAYHFAPDGSLLAFLSDLGD
jgi:hypothetical protein